MTTETTKIDTAKTTEAPAKAAEAVIDTAATVAKSAVDTNVKLAKSMTKAAKPAKARRARKTSAQTGAKTAAKTARKSVRKTAKRASAPKKIINANIKAARTVGAKAAERIETMTKKTNSAFNFGAFDTVPAFAPFQNVFADAGERSQDVAKKSQKVAEELADLTRANVEAIVEAGKIAVEGTKSLGQDIIAKGRDGVEQASDAIRSLAEAKSPTEYVQLQGEFARASFDRMVTETSKMTEAMVKLAGEAFQPLQNRASANAQRFNSFVA